MEAKQPKKLWTALAVYLVVFACLLLITNLASLSSWISDALKLFRSILIGLVLAYLCNPIFRFFERKPFYNIRPHSLRRALALICAYLTVFLIFVILLMLIVPQLVSSIQSFVENIDTSLANGIEDVNAMIDLLNGMLPQKPDGGAAIPALTLEGVKKTLDSWTKNIKFDGNTVLNLLSQHRDEIVKYAGEVLQLLGDIVLGIFISIYVLVNKEKRYAQVMRFRRAFFSDKVNAVITNVCTTADQSFGGFLRGKILDSSIVGLLVYCLISLLGVPYAILIAVIIAITDIVPVIGPFVGVIPSAVIILLTDPSKVIPFVLCILVVQQIDGNIIAPKILGENTGVSSLCVIIAISTMGALWGLAGMVLGVPIFATVLELSGAWLDKKLRQKGLPTDTDIYQSVEMVTTIDTMDSPKKYRRNRQAQPSASGGEGDLTAYERFSLETYALAIKHSLFSRKSDESLLQFATEEAKVVEIAEEEIAAEVIAQEEAAKIEEALEEALAMEADTNEAKETNDAVSENAETPLEEAEEIEKTEESSEEDTTDALTVEVPNNENQV